mmetsp:Transcript_11718/g.18156  ORF Transcript_11718/g.18156 Transcript_11718/m.18156 type:complete len:398 (+) Transcript_11718:104-1297(+)
MKVFASFPLLLLCCVSVLQNASSFTLLLKKNAFSVDRSRSLRKSVFSKFSDHAVAAGKQDSKLLLRMEASAATQVQHIQLDGPKTVGGIGSTAALSGFKSTLVKFGMLAFIASMCVALPITLFPPELMHRLKLIDRTKREWWSLRTGQFCARWLLRFIPFCSIDVVRGINDDKNSSTEPQPSVWVCNHTSMLDIFILLAADKKFRGKHKRPIKIVYWKGLEDNPITKLLFTQSGFISVDMADNGNGNDNEYDISSFKSLLKQTKQAFQDGFDIGILPEGQLNPTPEKGLLPCFSGAFTLARMARRPIQMMSLYGVHKLWHPDETIGMVPTGRNVKIRVYPNERKFKSSDEFVDTFSRVVGQFGATGQDLEEPLLTRLLDGTEWKEKQEQKKKEADAE